MLADLRYALRTLARSPAYTAVAIVVLALGIGANTAMFSVVHAVLLSSLPYAKPDRLVMLWMRFTGIGVPKDQNWVSAPEFTDLRQHSQAFSHLAAIDGESFNIRVGDRPERVEGAAVSPSLFPLLGVQPMLGRAFRPEEETPGRDNVALVSYGLWRRRFASDPNLPGKTLTLNGRSFQIAGVMPQGFRYPADADLWTPLAFPPQDPSSRGNHGLLVVARIRDGISFAAARADMERVSQRIIDGAPAYPYTRFGFRVLMNPLLEEEVGDIRPALVILMGAVAFVLLIACSNVANLVLARASGREREFAIRTALGAGWVRLVRQLLTESLVLAIAGAVAGLLLAKWSLLVLTRLAVDVLPRMTQVELNLPVLGFTMLVALLTGVAFGLWPALHASGGFKPQSLKEGGRGGTSGGARQRLRGALVVAEVSLSLILLAGAGLLIRSFLSLQKVDPGFRPGNVLTMRISLPQTRYGDPAKIRNFYGELSRRIRELHGVEAVGAISGLPLSGNGWSGTTTVDSQSVPADRRSPEADRRPVTPGLFQALGIGLVRGRYFEERDSENALPVAIIDETMAETFWPGGDPIGKRLKPGGLASTSPWRTIVGVVRHVRYRTLEAPSRVQFYWPEAQNPSGSLSLAIRTANDPRSLAGPIERLVLAIDPEQPVYAVRTMDELMENSMARRRLSMLLLSVFAALALVLAAVGIYGVISYSVAQRTQELGIRMALGASRVQVLRMVLGQSLGLVLAGVVLGLAGGILLTRFMAGLLFHVRASDPATFAAVALMLLAAGLVAALVPARRATLIQPIEALRQE
jgi:predicted permease